MEVIVCPNCGEENPARFRLCGFCGTALTPALPAQEVRKPATFIFVDLKGSTALTERIDHEAMNEIKKRYFAVMAAQIEHHGGTIEKYIGDAIMAVFGIPRAHEDDALRAVRAAYGMQQELVRLNVEFLRSYGVELANRTGVNTGEVVANTDPSANQQLATGDTVNVAARLEQAAPPNEILIGETTYELVRTRVAVEAVEPLELKGKSERVGAFRLLSIRQDGASVESLRQAPLVGREREQATLEGAYRRTVEGATCNVVTVVGDPGVGKSRLVREFTSALSGTARVVRGRCLPYGNGITFWPLAEIAREAAGIVEDDSPEVALTKLRTLMAAAGTEADAIVDRIAAAIGLSVSQLPVSELFWGGRRFLETLAADRPVLMVVDDIHWAESTFLDFLEHLVAASRTFPILVLCTARHVLLEKQADWGERTGSLPVELGPLTAEDAAGMVDHLLGGSGLDEVTRTKVVSAADGNPLFVEQMVSMLVDKGLLRRVGTTWVPAQEIADVAVPPTIQALLASRLDDLSREERLIVEPASVIGLVFFEPAVEEMVPQPIRATVPIHLGSLDHKQFVARDAADPDGETYRFRHGLIREATYGSLLKRTRAQLHESFVTWAERVNRERGREQEFEEILGFHLEQSYSYRIELGPLDDVGRELGRRASAKLGSAGQRAFWRGDLPAAINLLRRAAAVLQPDDPERLALLAELTEALSEAGDFEEARRTASEGSEVAQRSADARLAARLRIASLNLDVFGAEVGLSIPDAIAAVEATMETFRLADDQGGLARAWRLLMIIHGTAGQLELATVAAEEVVQHALRANDMRIGGRGAMGYVSIALHGPRPISEVRARSESYLELVRGDRYSEATIFAALAQLHAMDGDFERARQLVVQYRATLLELGPSVSASSTSLETSRVDILADDLAVAEADLQRDYEALGEMGERYFRSTIGAILAWTLASEGKANEAIARSVEVEGLADPDDVATQVIWRIARAKALAASGQPGAAVPLAEEAVALAEEAADSVVVLADAHLDLGDIHDAGGSAARAVESWTRARDLYDAKGDRVSADRAKGRLAAAAVG